VCYGFPIRTILVLYIHDGDSQKGYEIGLTGMKILVADLFPDRAYLSCARLLGILWNIRIGGLI
jgi:hypothetical protein